MRAAPAGPGLGAHHRHERRSARLRCTRRYVQPAPFVTIAFPAASAEHPSVSYQLEVGAIYPHLDGLTDEPLFDGFKRGFLNIFQVNPGSACSPTTRRAMRCRSRCSSMPRWRNSRRRFPAGAHLRWTSCARRSIATSPARRATA
ncbi:MAG: hypothetical protein U1E76_22670 [Planctomycetota bacterium]